MICAVSVNSFMYSIIFHCIISEIYEHYLLLIIIMIVMTAWQSETSRHCLLSNGLKRWILIIMKVLNETDTDSELSFWLLLIQIQNGLTLLRAEDLQNFTRHAIKMLLI